LKLVFAAEHNHFEVNNGLPEKLLRKSSV
jgi:hypothetical protein